MKVIETETTLAIVLVLAVAVYFWLRNRTDTGWDPISRLLNRF